MSGQRFPADYRPGHVSSTDHSAHPVDRWHDLAADFFRAYGRHFGHGVLLALLVFGLIQARNLFRELDALREAKAAVMAQAPAPTAAIPSSGERILWGPPMHVIVEGRPYTVRAVMEEGR